MDSYADEYIREFGVDQAVEWFGRRSTDGELLNVLLYPGDKNPPHKTVGIINSLRIQPAEEAFTESEIEERLEEVSIDIRRDDDRGQTIPLQTEMVAEINGQETCSGRWKLASIREVNGPLATIELMRTHRKVDRRVGFRK